MIYGWNVLELWQVFGALTEMAPQVPDGASAAERPEPSRRATSAARQGSAEERSLRGETSAAR